MNSIIEFTKSISEDAAHPRIDYERQKKRIEVVGKGECSKDEAVEIFGKNKYDLTLGERADKLNIFSKSSFVKEIMKKSNVPQEIILLKNWLSIGDYGACKFAECYDIKELLAKSENLQVQELLEDLRRSEKALDEYELRRLRKNLEGKEKFLHRRQWSKGDDSIIQN